VPSNRLIVIDDEPSSSATIGRIARGCGYDPIFTTDADDFRSRTLSWNPTVIVMDLAMPEMDGGQLMEWLALQGCKAHILIVSGHDLARLREAEETGRALGLKIAGSLQKPLHLELLRTVFREIYEAAGVLSAEDVSKALNNGEFSLAYQPLVDLKGGAVIGFEALSRWNHPTRGAIPPATFIPTLETNEAMNGFTLHVLRMALDDMRRWNGATNFGVSINVSAANCGTMGLDEVVPAECIEKGIDIRRLTLEITETAVMFETARVDVCLRRLHALGAQVSIDDFGTGHSSLVKLHELPFSELKIDRKFVANCASDHQSSVLVQAMTGLAHSLNKRVVAEGVETRETMDRLRAWNCDICQGFFIGGPMPPEDVSQWLNQHSAIAASR